MYQISGMTAAVPFYESYVELEPDDLAQREYLIRMLMAQGDHQKATDHAMTYLEKNPQNDGVVDNLLNLRSRLQPRWLEITTALVEKRPDTPKYLLDMAQYHYDRVENPQTLEFARRYTQAQPEDLTGWMLLGDANKRMGQHQQAQQAFDRILRIEPNNVRAHTDKAATYMEQGQLERAWRSAGTALRLDPENAYANAVMGDAAYRHLMQKLNTEKPGTDLDKMPFNYREYIKDIVVERYYNKARNDPQWRDYANNQINYLSQFFPQPQDRFMAPPEDRVKIEFPPPA